MFLLSTAQRQTPNKNIVNAFRPLTIENIQNGDGDGDGTEENGFTMLLLQRLKQLAVSQISQKYFPTVLTILN